MSEILDLLNSDLGQSIVKGVSGQTGQDESKTSNVLTMALPILMQAMKRNAATPEGAEGLLGALNNSNHDGRILDDIGGPFGGGVDTNVMDDGGKILGHILGNKQPNVEAALGQKSGMDTGSIAQILKIAAPLLLGLLGKQSRQQNINSSTGIEGMLGGLLRGNSQEQEQSFLNAMLDANGDGSIIDDVAGMVLDSGKKKGGLGGLLGGLFNS